MSSLLVSALVGSGIPLGINIPTFFVMRRMVTEDPSKLMKANVTSFLVKMTLYGIITVIVVTVVELHVVTFIATFFGVFVLLHLAEALYFRRLFLTWNSK
ncbi:MAG: hypothetical protein V3U24_07875 [Candidatus Neomarinimicrobiota bacterium]